MLLCTCPVKIMTHCHLILTWLTHWWRGSLWVLDEKNREGGNVVNDYRVRVFDPNEFGV